MSHSRRSEITDRSPSEAFLNGGWGRVRDASAYSGCSEITLLREIRRRRLIAFRLGGRRLLVLKRQHVDAWVEQHTTAVPVGKPERHGDR